MALRARERNLAIIGGGIGDVLRPKIVPRLLSFARLSCAVICNSVSPAQKEDMVKLARDNIISVRTLAIGDGADDVAMIQAAHVGVGISGQEGMQAVNSSDYAIAQFRVLGRLLLVHGRWNYIRISKLILYMFYKNITLPLALYWYGYLSGASGSTMYWEIGVQLYNIAFTGLPIVVVGVLDKDLPAPFSIEFPDLYHRGPDRFFFNMYTFFRWVAAAFYELMVIFVVMSYGCNAFDKAAGSESRVEFDMIAFSLTVLIVNIRLDDRGSMDSTQTPYIATFKVGYDEYGAFTPTAKRLGMPPVYVPPRPRTASSGNNGRRKVQTSSHYNHVEEQTLSMSLDDVHATSYLTDFGHTDAEIVKAQHHEQQRNKSLSSTADVYRDSMSEDGNRVPTKMFHPTTTNQRTTGYAFSCDEETTLAESYIASNSCRLSDAILPAMRNSPSS
ncbi:unnamed protein product [Peronospora effusa]|nr:unnamed protein product [Peronospora effusa]